jgi:hypothetical protein
MKRILLAVVVIIAAVGGWYYASPLMALDGMHDAAVANDADKLSGYIDYEALRSDLKSDLRRSVMKEIQKDKPNGMEALGAAFAMALLDPMVDAMISPEGIETMFDQKKAQEERSGKPSLSAVAPGEDPIVERNGLDEFKVRNRENPDGALVFHRDGIGWKLAGIDLPEKP